MDKKVFVGGLHWQSNEQSLFGYFAQFGDIEQVKLILDKQTGRSKGYGFVIFTTPDAAQKAVVNGYPVIDGKKCNCNLASLGVKPDGSGATQQQQQPPEKRKRNFQEYGGYGQEYGNEDGGGADYGNYQSGYPYGYQQYQQQGYPGYQGHKRPRTENLPQETYLQQLAQEGKHLTLEEARQRVEQMRTDEPTEAYKFFLEVGELFRSTPEYEGYYRSLLDAARRVRVQQAIQDGQQTGLVIKYSMQ